MQVASSRQCQCRAAPPACHTLAATWVTWSCARARRCPQTTADALPCLAPLLPTGHDASFHTAEWHAARLAALTMERPRWVLGACVRWHWELLHTRASVLVILLGPTDCHCCSTLMLPLPAARCLQPCSQKLRTSCPPCPAFPRSWDDWKKQQDEAAAREAAMEAANAQADRECGCPPAGCAAAPAAPASPCALPPAVAGGALAPLAAAVERAAFLPILSLAFAGSCLIHLPTHHICQHTFSCRRVQGGAGG